MREVPRRRLVGWAILVVALASLSYSVNLLTRVDVVVASNTSPIEIRTDPGAESDGSSRYETGERLSIRGVKGNTDANGTWTITVTGPDTFTLNGSTGNGAYTSGGAVRPGDVLFLWSTAVGGLVQYAIVLLLVLLLARGLAPETLGLVRPTSWRHAAGMVAVGLVAILVVGALLNLVLKAGEEQGLVPDDWDSDRATAFVANFVVVALVAPFVEELTYRGLGMAAVASAFGTGAAVVVTALAFGLAHGLVVGLPVLTIFGLVLGWLRLQTRSLYPPIILHAVFNAISLIASVAA